MTINRQAESLTQIIWYRAENARLEAENAALRAELEQALNQLRATARDLADAEEVALELERRLIEIAPALPHWRQVSLIDNGQVMLG